VEPRSFTPEFAAGRIRCERLIDEDNVLEVMIVFELKKSEVVGWTARVRRPRFLFAWLAMGIFAAACDGSAFEGDVREVRNAVATVQAAPVEDVLLVGMLKRNGEHPAAHVRHPAVIVSGELPPVTVTLFEHKAFDYGAPPWAGVEVCLARLSSRDPDVRESGVGPGRACAESPDAAFAIVRSE
jgi:hypothetical protein